MSVFYVASVVSLCDQSISFSWSVKSAICIYTKHKRFNTCVRICWCKILHLSTTSLKRPCDTNIGYKNDNDAAHLSIRKTSARQTCGFFSLYLRKCSPDDQKVFLTFGSDIIGWYGEKKHDERAAFL